jgi:glucosamine-6-phosphate deaminase
LKEAHFINGNGDPGDECRRISEIIKKCPSTWPLLGLGKMVTWANDPPADFETLDPFIIVELDENCRRQQLGEGWFKTIGNVPERAITMSINQIMKSRQIICSVPDSRKAKAVKDCFENPVSNLFPAGILQKHEGCICFLDKSSSALLSNFKTGADY